jgi:hypothetical protein
MLSRNANKPDRRIFTFLFYVLFCVFVEADESFLKKADALYENGKRDEARRIYEQAAKRGVAEAHYQLSYRFVLARTNRLYHIVQAAKTGHEKALASAWDEFVFRAGTDLQGDPHKAWALYQDALQKNLGLQGSVRGYDKTFIEVVRKSAELPDIELREILIAKGVDLGEPNEKNCYWVWELAEEASVGGRFGPPDPVLTMQLIVHGGFVPAEFVSAVEEYYPHYQKREPEPFRICDHVTSSYGSRYCLRKSAQKAEIGHQKITAEIEKRIGTEWIPDVREAFVLADAYFAARAKFEEGHSGGGGWKYYRVEGSVMEHRKRFFDDISIILEGKIPQVRVRKEVDANASVDQKFNALLKTIADHPEDAELTEMTVEGVRESQSAWMKYREAMLAVLAHLCPAEVQQDLRQWLDKDRCRELAESAALARGEPWGK